ncbi:MAG: TIM barrel protein [bacterium]
MIPRPEARVGFKLDIGFQNDDACRRLFGPRDPLETLRAWGAGAVESALGPETDFEEALLHVRRCLAQELRVSFHPYTEGTPHNPAWFSEEDSQEESDPCRRLHERVFRLAAEAARLQQTAAIVNIHAAAASCEIPRSTLAERSVRFFRWAARWSARHAPGVRPVAELQIRPDPAERIHRIGDHYPELIKVVRAGGVRACWDFGHAFMNARRFGLSLDPPAGFLDEVGHVHCHDVEDREDHRPLSAGQVPWPRFLEALLDRGFRGTVILEVPVRNFLGPAGGGFASLEESVRRLVSFVRDRTEQFD